MAPWPDRPFDAGPGGGPEDPDGGGLPDWAQLALLVVGGALGSMLLLLGLAWALDDDGDETALDATETTIAPSTTPSTTPSEPAPSTTEAPEQDPGTTEAPDQDPLQPPAAEFETIGCPDGTDPVICDAAAFVEQAQGRPFQEFPVVSLADDAEFEADLLQDFEEGAEEIRQVEAFYQSVGLIDPDVDLIEAYRSLLSVGVVGFYDPEIEEMVVRGTEFGLYARSVLVHELVHAHDDQWRDLTRPELDDRDDEAGFGFTAVVEGNAVYVEQLWRDSLTPAEQEELAAEEFALLGPDELQALVSLPPVLLESLGAPYTYGEILLQEVVAARGADAVDDLFEDPPTTSEQVLDPAAFLEGDEPITVPVPEAPGDELLSGVVGEFVIEQWFGAPIDGWGGDGFVTVDAGDGRACTTMEFVADDETSLAEVRELALRWADQGTDRSVLDQDVAGLPGLRVVGCG